MIRDDDLGISQNSLRFQYTDAAMSAMQRVAGECGDMEATLLSVDAKGERINDFWGMDTIKATFNMDGKIFPVIIITSSTGNPMSSKDSLALTDLFAELIRAKVVAS